MFLLYLKERISWISFYLLMLVILNLLFFLDEGLAGVSKIYINIVLCVGFVLFVIVRYVLEVTQLKNFLGNVDAQLDEGHTKMLYLSAFQRIYFEKIETVFEEKEMELNKAKIQLQEDSDGLLAWVHEVKAPLTSMNLMVEQVEDRRLRQKLEHEWLRIHLLVDQQLHQTRLASIEKDNRLMDVSLKIVMYKEIRMLQSWCLEKGIGFEISELEVDVISDTKWLAFIVRQLLSNAIKYSNANSEITIFTESEALGATLLHIKDEGIGIRPEDLPRIFNKSYTGTVGRESAQSTGMGLYLASNAAQKLGIKISVTSIIGQGSIFTLRFPIQNEYAKLTGR